MQKIHLEETSIIGKGSERACYHHTDENKAVKISYEQNIGRSKQTVTEIKYYKELGKKSSLDWRFLPKFYGEADTNMGEGFVVELIRDYDGTVSRSFAYYINNFGVDKYKKELEEYKQFFLDYKVIFNYGMMPKNILLRRTSEDKSNLVLIDGLGDITYFTFPNKIPYFAKQKILRRWEKFEKKYLTGKKVLEA